MSMIFNDLKENEDNFCFGGYMNALPVQKKNTDIEELKAYRAIGTVSEFRELKEKATAKRPKTKKYVCPNCKRTLNVTRYDTYCEICCGRLYVDWSEGKE